MKTIKVTYSLSHNQFVKAQRELLRAVTTSRVAYWFRLLDGVPRYEARDNQDLTVTFDDNGVELVHPRFRSTVQWNYYATITETPDFVLLIAADGSGGTAVPKTAFASSNAVRCLLLK